MSQGNLVIPNTGTLSGLAVVNDINAGLVALASANSGASAPANATGAAPVQGQIWLDTSTSPPTLRQYDGAGSNWVAIGVLDTTNHIWTPPVGGGTGTLASATTCDLGSIPQAYVSISGTTTIAGFGASMVKGTIKFVEFQAALTLTYNASSMINPTAADILTAAGDCAIVLALGSGNYRILG
jgi:hypothetical protein